MKASETQLLPFLQKSVKFQIPIYQRRYSWTKAQCQQLWDDVLQAGCEHIPAHFIGSIVYIESGLYQHSSIPNLLVIDGQQRLTSVMLFITALIKNIEARTSTDQPNVIEGISARKLKNYYLCNAEEDGDLFYKLGLTRSDNTWFKQIIDQDLTAIDDVQNNVILNFLFFLKKLNKLDIKSLNLIYQGLQKLLIVDISLDKERDDPQLIFESLNSTGLDLNQVDLVRNYLLMKTESSQQGAMYDRYWFPMEQVFQGHEDCLNDFIRHYLTIKTNEIPKLNEVYVAFKNFIRKNITTNIEQTLSDLYQYAKYYAYFALGQESHPPLKTAFDDLKQCQVEVAYPLLLTLYSGYQQDKFSIDDFEASVRLIESYVFRRSVCGIPSNSLNKTFATLARHPIEANHLEALKAHFLMMTTYRRFPTDVEFKITLSTKDMYNIRTRSYWLGRLENQNRKEKVNISEYSVEHILAQDKNLSTLWQSALREDWQAEQEALAHTIGNLTLTGYNSEMSNKWFTKKRDMKGGFADSPLRLNQSLRHLQTWNREQIEKRTQLLSDQMIEIWRYPPRLPAETLNKYQPQTASDQEYNINSHPNVALGGSQHKLYEALKQKILMLDENMAPVYLKRYIAFKLDTNVVDIVPLESHLKLYLNCKFTDLIDSKGWCRDVTHIGSWGNGDAELKVDSESDIPYAIQLIQQVVDQQLQG